MSTATDIEELGIAAEELYDQIKKLDEAEANRFKEAFWPFKTLTDQLSDVQSWAEERMQELELEEEEEEHD